MKNFYLWIVDNLNDQGKESSHIIRMTNFHLWVVDNLDEQDFLAPTGALVAMMHKYGPDAFFVEVFRYTSISSIFSMYLAFSHLSI